MGALRAKLADASQREADLLARYSSSHPAVVNVDAEKRDIVRSIAAETQRIAQTVRSEYSLAKARQNALEQAMHEATGQGGLDSDAAIRLRELERTAAVNKTLFEEFLQKAKISDEQSTLQARDARVVRPAQPGGQSFPDRQRVLMTALLVGFGLGVGGAILMEMLKHGFTTPQPGREIARRPRPCLCATDGSWQAEKKWDDPSGCTIPSRASTLTVWRSNADAAKRHPHVGCGSAAEGHPRHVGSPW